LNGSYITIDNFEFTGFCWDTSQAGFGNNIMLAVNGSVTPDNDTAEHLYFHGWTHTAAAAQGASNAGSAFQGYNQNPGIIWQYNVIDGADSDPFSLNGMVSEAYIVQYSIFRYFQGNYSVDTCHILHDNLFEHLDNVTDGSNHSDVMQCAGEASNGQSDPNLFYNNVFRYIPDSGQPLSMILGNYVPSGQTDYDFNNVFHDISAGSNYLIVNDPVCGFCGGSVTYYNNTAVEGSSSCLICIAPNTKSITSINNLWIADPATEADVFQNTSIVTENHSVYMTSATAAGQGYKSANDFAPTASTNSSVGAGTSNSTFCNGLSDTTAKNSCLSGTTNGCKYVVSNHTVSCPAIQPTARLSTAWDAGAYQFSSTAKTTPPQGSTAQPR